MAADNDAKYDWLNTTAGMGLGLVAFLQILKVCQKDDDDDHNSEAMMDEN